jgi:hypothetical protein
MATDRKSEATESKNSNNVRFGDETTEVNQPKNEGTGVEIMEEEKKPIDFGKEYGSSITESMTYRQYLADAAWSLDNFNPVSRFLPLRSSMPDEDSKKMIDGVVKGDVPAFLESGRQICQNCLKVGVEISNIALELAKKRKGQIEKY